MCRSDFKDDTTCTKSLCTAPISIVLVRITRILRIARILRILRIHGIIRIYRIYRITKILKIARILRILRIHEIIRILRIARITNLSGLNFTRIYFLDLADFCAFRGNKSALNRVKFLVREFKSALNQ